MSQADVDVAERFLKAFAAGDAEGMFGLIHPEIVIDEGAGLPFAGTWTGPEGVQELIETIMTPFDMVLDSFEVSDGGDCAIARLRLTFTNRRTGRAINMTSVELYRSADTKVRSIDVYYKSTARVAELLEG